MRIYIINYQKDNKKFKKVVLKASNDLSGEVVYYTGFLRELETEREWGKNGWLESYAEISRDKPFKK